MEGGPWGVMIIVSAFMIQVLTFGMAGSIGVYNIELLEYFGDASTVDVSLIGSINFGVFLGSGPIVSFLLTKFSYRSVALLGSALVVIGLLGMPLLPYIPAMCVCFGFLNGFGSCCVYIPSHVLSGLYYHKYRSLATGIATSGSGLGGATMPILVGLLIQHYSWKGSLIFMSGLCLHLFIFSALLRAPPLPSKEVNIIDSNIPVEKGNENKEKENEKYDCAPGDPSENPLLGSFDENVDHSFTAEGEKQSQLIGMDPHFRTNLSVKARSLPGLNSLSASQNHLHCRTVNVEGKFQKKCHLHLVDQAAFHTTSVNCLHSANLHGSGPIFMDTRTDNCWMMPLPVTQPEGENEKLVNSSRHVFIFFDYGFDVYFISNLLWNITASVIIAFVPEFLHHEGGCTLLESAWLIGVAGLGCFIGGILGGLFGNLKWVNRKVLYSGANLVMGLCMITLPFFNSFVMYGICLLTYGLAIGVILGLLVVILTDLVGVDSLVNGLGYLMLSNGLGSFIGPPIAGAIRDTTGSFWSTIILAGSLAIVGGLVMLLLPLKSFFQKQRLQRKK